MIFFKNYKFYFLGFCFLSLSACSFRNHNAAKDSVRFQTVEAQPVTVMSVDNGQTDSYAFPTERAFQLSTCLVDRQTQTPLALESVVISGGNAPPTQTDAKGCFYWTETFHFRMLAHEYFVGLNREITVKDEHSKSKNLPYTASLKLAINPWLGRDGVRDLRPPQSQLFTIIPETLSEAALLGKGQYAIVDSLSGRSSNLAVVNPRVDFVAKEVDARTGTRYEFSERFSAAALRVRYNGVLAVEPLHEGTFRSRVMILERHSDGRWSQIYETVTPKPASVEKDGGVFVAHDIFLKHSHPIDSQLFVEYLLEPTDENSGLLPARGWIKLEPAGRDYRGSEHFLERPSGAMVPRVAVDRKIPDALAQLDPTLANGFTIKPPEFKLVDKGHALPNQWLKTVTVETKFCPVTATPKPESITGLAFQFGLVDASQTTLSAGAPVETPQPDGCIVFWTLLSFPVAQPILPIAMNLIIRGVGPTFEKAMEHRELVQINPWEETQFARNVTRQQRFSENHYPNESSRVTIKDNRGSYEAHEETSKISEYLRLVRSWQHTLQLRPTLFRSFRYDATEKGEDPTFKYPEGTVFRVEGILAAKNSRRKNLMPGNLGSLPSFMAAFTTEAKVDGSGLLSIRSNFPIEFHVENQAKLKANPRIYLKLTPLGNMAPRPLYVAANFFVPVRQGTFNLTFDNSELVQTHFELLKPLNLEEQYHVEEYDDHKGKAYYYKEDWKGRTPLQTALRFTAPGYRLTQVSLDGSLSTTSEWIDGRRNEMLSDLKDVTFAEMNPVVSGEAPLVTLLSTTGTGSRPAVLGKFCKWLMNDKAPAGYKGDLPAYVRSRCEKNPAQFIHAVYFEALEDAPTILSATPSLDYVNVESRFTNFKSNTLRDHYGNMSEKTWVKTATSKLGSEVIGTGAQLTAGWAWADKSFETREFIFNNDLTTGTSTASVKNFNVESIEFALGGARQTCAVVRLMSQHETLGFKKGYVFCKQTLQNFTETFAEMDEKNIPTESVLLNPVNPEDVGLIKVYRGQGLEEEKKKLLEKTITYSFTPSQPFLEGPQQVVRNAGDTGDTRRDYVNYFRDGGVFAGLTQLSVLEAPSRWADSEQFQYVNKCIERSKDALVRSKKSIGDWETSVMHGYCRCVGKKAGQRWDYKYFVDHEPELDEKLTVDGSDQYCWDVANGN
jgi:hypothetical protein